MAKIDHIPDEPSLADIVVLFKRLHDCMEQRFDEAAKERAAIAEQVRTDRDASKDRDMILDGGIDQLKGTIDSTSLTVARLRTTQLTVGKQAKKAADKAESAATAADAVGHRVEKITKALGLDGDGHKPVALWSPQKVLTWTAATGTTLFFFAKIADAVWPFVTNSPIVQALWRTFVTK